ncbi:LuxR C-terminal-related transcriptional regulator [Streptomyces bauhiniae]|uniref:helix-turn-helix transcriptional regulator n=1 Tax=Streptomyces bauhiniae TaxID=2340725 RepID=UPI0037CCFA87
MFSGLDSIPLGQQSAVALVNSMTRAWPALDSSGLAREVLKKRATAQSDAEHYISYTAARALLLSGDAVAASEELQKLIENAARNSQNGWQARLESMRALLALAGGHLEAAVAGAETALHLMPPSRWGYRIGGLLGTLMLAHLGMGRPSRAEQYLAADVPEQMFRTSHGLVYRYCVGHLALQLGSYRTALAHFMSCGHLMTGWGLKLERIMPWRLSAAAAYILLHEHEAALGLIEAVIEQQNRSMISTLASDEGTGGWSEDQVFRAARERTFAWLIQAAAEPDLFLSVVRLQQGARLRHEGITIARYKIDDRYSQYLSRLTVTEQKVSALVAGGSANKSIARELRVTVSTVEQHLTKIYRKLGIKNRSELRARLG